MHSSPGFNNEQIMVKLVLSILPPNLSQYYFEAISDHISASVNISMYVSKILEMFVFIILLLSHLDILTMIP